MNCFSCPTSDWTAEVGEPSCVATTFDYQFTNKHKTFMKPEIFYTDEFRLKQEEKIYQRALQMLNSLFQLWISTTKFSIDSIEDLKNIVSDPTAFFIQKIEQDQSAA